MARVEYHMRLQKGMSIMIVLLLLLQWWWSSHGCLEEERAALLQLQHSFNYPNGTSWPSWDLNIDCCKWDGVECDVTTERVNELDLWYFRDESLGEWKFNASVFVPFQQLRSLDLSFNNIVCCVKKEGFEGLQRLSNLEALYLGYNGLTNNVLSMFQGFHSLKNLSLASNKLNGLIYMKDFVNITNMEMLDLSNNNIEKFVSSEDIQSSSNISILRLSYGVCNGSNFELQSLKAFKNLKSLYLKENNFKGVLFPQDDLNKLEELFLDYSDMDENFLLSLGGLRSLRLLSLEGIYYESLNNQNFLNSVANVTSLESLLLNRCELTGNIDELCKLKNLRMLDLRGNRMSGTLPPCLTNLTLLQYLDLSLNRFIGNISASPLKSFNIQQLCKLKNLQRLDLGGNDMSGILPPCLANLTLLQYLDLSSNRFIGNISASPLKSFNIQQLCNLKNLQRLDLGGNDMSGILPPCLANLTLLQYLDLSFNYFIGNISTSPLKSLTSIEYLFIYDTQFQIPISLSPFLNYSKLKYLYAEVNEMYTKSGGVDNNLTPKFQLQELKLSSTYGEGFSFPRFLHHQYDLRSLDLFDIQMRGAGFPSWLLDNNTNLGSLYLGNCSLSEVLHLSIHPHSKLDYLDISNNQFYGHVPREIGRHFPMLSELNLQGNDFIGKIPNSLSNCSLLYVLDMNHNKLFDKIPEWIGNMSSLEYLALSNNNLFGSLPSIFIPLQATHIYLSHNRLEGPFPDVLPNSSVATLDLSHNCLTGSIPNSIKNLGGLMFVLLNHNNLEGEIPIYLWKMMNILKFVDLSHNRFDTLSLKNDTFKTPPENGYSSYYDEFLELVEKGNTYQYRTERIYEIGFIGLDLSSNNLSCSIPFEIGNKEGMKTLNLSRNNLIGHIPLSFSNMTEVESLDLSYNHLSGIFPPQLVKLKSLEVFSVAYNNISGKTPERVRQFATFEESSYRGNPFLCGLPLPKNCTPTESSMTKESSIDDINDGFIDMEIFQISFWVTFTVMLLGIVSILYINPYWRQAWFYFIELMITSCYYFLVDHLSFLSKFGITYLL